LWEERSRLHRPRKMEPNQKVVNDKMDPRNPCLVSNPMFTSAWGGTGGCWAVGFGTLGVSSWDAQVGLELGSV